MRRVVTVLLASLILGLPGCSDSAQEEAPIVLAPYTPWILDHIERARIDLGPTNEGIDGWLDLAESRVRDGRFRSGLDALLQARMTAALPAASMADVDAWRGSALAHAGQFKSLLSDLERGRALSLAEWETALYAALLVHDALRTLDEHDVLAQDPGDPSVEQFRLLATTALASLRRAELAIDLLGQVKGDTKAPLPAIVPLREVADGLGRNDAGPRFPGDRAQATRVGDALENDEATFAIAGWIGLQRSLRANAIKVQFTHAASQGLDAAADLSSNVERALSEPKDDGTAQRILVLDAQDLAKSTLEHRRGSIPALANAWAALDVSTTGVQALLDAIESKLKVDFAS